MLSGSFWILNSLYVGLLLLVALLFADNVELRAAGVRVEDWETSVASNQIDYV